LIVIFSAIKYQQSNIINPLIYVYFRFANLLQMTAKTGGGTKKVTNGGDNSKA